MKNEPSKIPVEFVPTNPEEISMNRESNSPFGDVIYAYTRAQAIADGYQVEVTKTAHEAGIRFPVFLTRTVYDQFVTVPEGVQGQDEVGRLWDIIPSS